MLEKNYVCEGAEYKDLSDKELKALLFDELSQVLADIKDLRYHIRRENAHVGKNLRLGRR